jgi:hypothetical protein
MLRRVAAPLLRGTRQLSSPAPPDADVLRAVQTIVREKAASESASLKDDLQLKFHVRARALRRAARPDAERTLAAARRGAAC